MSLKIDRVQLEIVINNDQARKSLRVLDEEAKTLTKEMKKLDKTSDEWVQKSNRLKSIKVQMDGIYESIGITNMTMKELSTRQRDLNSILLHMRPGTEEYKKLRIEADAVKKRMGELRGTAQQTGLSVKGLADGFNRYFGMITAFAASITGIALVFRKLANDVAKMDDVYSDVMKTTGKTRDEVLELNEVFKQMDTRTARESLNMLARDAGKLGLESRQDILDFVEAGNQINVALGEDLGDDAIKNIGKMVGVYKDASVELQNIGLKEQMLAMGSAVNELGASSTASEPYLVAFTGRMGGIAKQAGISASAILGFGSALDQDMQAVEMSATALQKFIMKIMAEPAKFAKIAGADVKEFSNLLRTDANAAILQVLSAMKDKGGFQEMIPIFQDMGLDGPRAVGVLSSMAGSIDKITTAQGIANQAMIEATSITDEYNIKNENLNAKLDKAKKNFQEKALILGESLTPALIKSTNGLSYLIKALVALPDFYRRNEVAIIMLVGAFIALQSAKLKVIAASLWEHITLQEGIGLKIKDAIVLRALMVQEEYRLALIGKTTIAQKAAAIATATWRAALVALGGPLGIAILALTGIVAAIKLYDKHSAETVRLEALKIKRIAEVTEANKILEARYLAQQGTIKDLNRLNSTQIENLEKLTRRTIQQAEAELILAQASREAIREENTRIGVWDEIKIKLQAVYETKREILRAEVAAKNGAAAAADMDDNINSLISSIGNLKNQHTGLTDILQAEANADKIAASNVNQYQEKINLLNVALKNAAIGSEDFARISGKLDVVTKELKKATNTTIDNNEKLLSSYEKLSAQIAVYKTQLTNLVTAGDIDEAMKVGKLLKHLEDSKKYIDEIIAAGGDLEAVIDKVRISVADEGLSTDEAWMGDLAEEMKAELDLLMGTVDVELEPIVKPKFGTDFYLDQISTAANASFDIWANSANARMDYELGLLDKQMAKELKNKNLTEDQKDAIREKYAKKEAAIKTAQFKKQKVADIIRATIDGTLAVIKAGGLITPLGVATAISTAAQIAVIAAMPVPQFAKGRYNVIGADDGRSYNAAYTGSPETKIYTQPSLVAEQGSELIVDSRTTRNLMMNYPGIIEAIYAARVPQRAEGNLGGNFSAPSGFDADTVKAIREFTQQLKQPVRGQWVLYDLEKSQQKLTDIETEATF